MSQNSSEYGLTTIQKLHIALQNLLDCVNAAMQPLDDLQYDPVTIRGELQDMIYYIEQAMECEFTLDETIDRLEGNVDQARSLVGDAYDQGRMDQFDTLVKGMTSESLAVLLELSDLLADNPPVQQRAITRQVLLLINRLRLSN